MALDDEKYSKLVDLYKNLDDQKIHELNAKLILLLMEEIADSDTLSQILEKISCEE